MRIDVLRGRDKVRRIKSRRITQEESRQDTLDTAWALVGVVAVLGAVIWWGVR